LKYLVQAFRNASPAHPEYRLVIAGRPKRGFESHWSSIEQLVAGNPAVISRIEFIPEEDTELYFKAADVLVLPYTSIFQSGVLFLGYSFGLPVLVADVGSLKDDIEEGETGFWFAARDAAAIERALETYFSSELFLHLPVRRFRIRQHAIAKYSWANVSTATRQVYAELAHIEPPRVATAAGVQRAPKAN
jgi:glycosyltransferase involved in cell wall biosynthesis